MDNIILDEKTSEQGNLTLDQTTIGYLKESRGWAMFLQYWDL